MPKIIQSSGLMRMAFLCFVDLGSDFMDCTSWTWLPLLFNIPGWPLKAGLLLGFPHLSCFLLNPWNGFHHDLLLLPWAARALLGCAAFLPPHQCSSARHSKA